MSVRKLHHSRAAGDTGLFSIASKSADASLLATTPQGAPSAIQARKRSISAAVSLPSMGMAGFNWPVIIR